MNDQANKLLPDVPIQESFSRIAQIMRGLVPSVRTIGIVTAENPMGEALPTAENKTRNERLRKVLKRGNYGFTQVKGKYGNVENPYIVYNIQKDSLVHLAKHYGQESVIFGYTTDEGMTFEYIERPKDAPNYSVQGERDVFLHVDDDVEDFYTEVKGRKFIIPLFDEDLEDAEWQGGAVIKKSDIPATEEAQALVREIEERVERVTNPNLAQNQATWGSRGIILTRLVRLEALRKLSKQPLL